MNSSMSIMSIENYEALLVYYKTVSIIQSSTACYIVVALPEIFNKVDVFESDLPFHMGL